MMSGSYGNKGGATHEAFHEQCFLLERGAPVRADFRLCNFEDLLNAQVYNILKKRKMKKQNGSPLTCFEVPFFSRQ